MDAQDKHALVEMIATAWKDVQYPGDDSILTPGNIFMPSSYDDEDIVKYFSGTGWKQHTVQELRGHCTAISVLFSPRAYHYWLPAYLIAAVEDPGELSQGIDSLVCSLLPNRGWDHEARMALLTKQQKVVVAKVIESLVDLYGNSAYPQGTKDEESVLSYLHSVTSVA